MTTAVGRQQGRTALEIACASMAASEEAFFLTERHPEFMKEALSTLKQHLVYANGFIPTRVGFCRRQIHRRKRACTETQTPNGAPAAGMRRLDRTRQKRASAAIEASYTPSLALKTSLTRSRSASVSTPAGSASSSTSTAIFSPFQRARSCSRLSVSSIGAGGSVGNFSRNATR